MLWTLYSASAFLMPQYFENFVFDIIQRMGSKINYGDPFEGTCPFHWSSETRKKLKP